MNHSARSNPAADAADDPNAAAGMHAQPPVAVTEALQRVAEFLDARLSRRFESDVAPADALDDELCAAAARLETHATANPRLAIAAMRAGRAAMRICDEPTAAIETIADEQHVSRRQLERDFNRWLGTSPRQLAQVARVQAVSRRAQAGESLADIAADLGFADQAHMSRVVRQLTGLTPRRFLRTAIPARRFAQAQSFQSGAQRCA